MTSSNIFVGEKYDLWATKMRTYLRAQTLGSGGKWK